MVRQRLSDGENELPLEEVDSFNGECAERARSFLMQQFQIAEPSVVFPVGIYHNAYGGDCEIVTSYAVFLDKFPGNAYGINWRALTPDAVLFDALLEDDERILADAKKAFSMRLVCGEFEAFTPEIKKKLMDAFLSKDDLKRISDNLGAYGRSVGISSFSDDELKKELIGRKYQVYKYFRANYAVDFVILGTKISRDVLGRVNKVELQIPLIKRKSGLGAGWWGLPGGFIEEKDFEKSGWKPQRDKEGNILDTEFDPSQFEDYRNALKDGKRVVTSAAKRILETKTGIKLDENATIYSLFLRDNPCRGTADRSPVVASTLLAVIGDYEMFPQLSWEGNVEVAKWFTIKRMLFNEKGEAIKEGNESIDVSKATHLSSGKKAPVDLRCNPDSTDAFLFKDSLVINYFKGSKIDRQKSLSHWNSGKGTSDPLPADRRETDLWADHKDAIIDALQLIKEKTHTSTILVDFLRPHVKVSLGQVKLTYEEIVFPEVTVREYLIKKIVSNEENNGFLEKPDQSAIGEYVVNMEKFEEFLYRRVSIF